MNPDHLQLLVAQFIISLPVCGLLWKALNAVGKVLVTVRALEKKWDNYAVEHELLMVDYCERKDMSLSDLPTRTIGMKS